tara:strand:+ start:3632 stop:4837 length:1206 start_codon:yes stop_codon:yes gene_type:complete
MFLSATEQLTPEQRLERWFFEVCGKDRYKYMAPIILTGKTKVVDVEWVPTACTDGFNVLYSSGYIKKLSDEVGRAMILHENKHKEQRHMQVFGFLYKKHPKIANMACDMVINMQIVDENPDGWAKLGEGWLYDERFRGMDIVQIFNTLYEEDDAGGGGGGEGDGDGGYPAPFDEHDWESAEELSEEERESQIESIDQAVREGATLAGKTGGDLHDYVQELVEPKVPWNKCMESFAREQVVGSDYGTFSTPNRRYTAMPEFDNIVMPTQVSDRIPELLVAMDTSGSCWSCLPYFLSETQSICKMLQPHVLHVMWWDTEVVYERFDSNAIDDIEIKSAYGGGGTDVNCVTEYMREHKINPTAAIILTDGYLSNGWGQWDCPTFWGMVTKKVPPFGKYVYVEEL